LCVILLKALKNNGYFKIKEIWVLFRVTLGEISIIYSQKNIKGFRLRK